MAFTAEQYKQLLQSLLPKGRLWTKDPNSNLVKVLHASGDELARVDAKADELIDEADPRTTTELIEEWEEEFGIPDECISRAATLERRREDIHSKMIAGGRLDPTYFINLAEALGVEITVTEFTPFWSGVGVSGDPCGDQDIIFHWLITTYFDDDEDSVLLAMKCIFEKYKPPHTIILWDYSAAFDWGFSRGFDAIPTQFDSWLYGGFGKGFSIGFDRRNGGGFDPDGFSKIGFNAPY